MIALYNKGEPLQMYSFRIPAGLMESIKSVCKAEGINQSQFVRASLVLALDVYFNEKTGKEIIEDGKE